MSSNDHYIPQFYLRRWCSDDGRLCRYSKPYDRIVPKRVSPKQTGRKQGLYGESETRFMKPLDTLASQALIMLEEDSTRISREPKYRSAWSRFLMSLMMRMPDHIEELKSSLKKEWLKSSPDLEKRYAQFRGTTDPTTLSEYLASVGMATDEWMMSVAENLMNHAHIGELLNNMRWITRRIDSEVGEFITSDRPLLMVGGLGEFDSCIMLPIGPKLLFAAVHNQETQDRIERRNPDEQVKAINEFVAGRAQEFVYSVDDKHLQDVAKNFGMRRAKSLFQQLAEFTENKN